MCLQVPEAVMPTWLAHLLVPIWRLMIQDAVLEVIEMYPGTIGCHARLTGTFVGAHLQLDEALVGLSWWCRQNFSTIPLNI